MKVIRNWDDLKPYGIQCLTGEACTLGARALCDLTPEGTALVREFFGLLCGGKDDAIFQPAWNCEGTCSMFLPWDILPSLSAFVMIKCDRCLQAVHVKQDGIYGVEDDDDQALVAQWLERQEVVRLYRGLNTPRVGLSAMHAMSGRAQ